MTPRERVMDEAVRREMAALGPVPTGTKATLDYLSRLFEAGGRILRTQLPPETWRERLSRWFR